MEYFEMLRNSSECQGMAAAFHSNGTKASLGIIPSIAQWQLLVIFLGLGLFTLLVALTFTSIRKRVFMDKENVDLYFDAGGQVSTGLTATTIVSQWTWVASLLQSSVVATKYGISGPFWYASGAAIQILLFAMISIQLKIRAPGAKTILQVIRARFGTKTHICFCFFALLTNIIVTAMLMLGGIAVLTNLVHGISVELATILVMVVISTYTLIGGLGATFYVCYFNTSLIFIIMIVFIIKVYNEPGNVDNSLGSLETVYGYLNCSLGPEGNKEHSYLTMVSQPGLMFGIINIVGNFGTVFVDQSYWQSSIAAKPRQGVWGFLLGGLTWFTIPFTFATTMGLAYIALSAQQGEQLLSGDDVNKGLVPAIVAQKLMGSAGELCILFIILMAVMSTGSAEVMAVSSILVYDIYCIYLCPFKPGHDNNTCILCGHPRGRKAVSSKTRCMCISMTSCGDCAQDDRARSKMKGLKPAYTCKNHGQFRIYNNYLSGIKNWCVLWSILAMLPLTLILNALNVSLGWVYLFMGVLIGSAIVPIALCMCWARLTGAAMMAGSIIGALSGIIAWLVVANTYPGGLGNFLENTGQELSMLAGNVAAILGGGVFTIIGTFFTNKNFSKEQAEETWEKTRDIDSPLSPWAELYTRDLNLKDVNNLDNRPSLMDVKRVFRTSTNVANVGAISLTVILIIIWPACMTTAGVFDLGLFGRWVMTSQVWAYVAAIVIIILPIINEFMGIKKALNRQKNSPEPYSGMNSVNESFTLGPVVQVSKC